VRTEAVVRAEGREYHVLGTVRGLVSEAVRVREAFERIRPHGVALGVGPEDLEGLRRLQGGEAYEHEFSEADEVYAHYLGQFGEVQLPPRDLAEALRLAEERALPVVAIDFPEVAYVDAFTKAVSGWQLLRYQRRVRKLAKKPPVADDAMDFHLTWDREVGRLGGFARLEAQREAHMAAELAKAALPAGRILVLVEGARAEGVLRLLETNQPANVH
jgi:hypothetical protein